MSTRTPSLACLVFAALCGTSLPAWADGDAWKGFVNISGVASGAGGTISITCTNSNGATIGSTSFTTSNGDADYTIANELDDNFSSPHTQIHCTRGDDKSHGEEVLVFTADADNGQAFCITVSNGDASVTVETRSSAADESTCSIVKSFFDIYALQGTVELEGQGTAWGNVVSAVDFGAGINVDSMSVVSATSIVCQISWESDAPATPRAVLVLGSDLEDDGQPLSDVVLDVAVEDFALQGSPWSDLGLHLDGGAGDPYLYAHGSLLPSSPGQLGLLRGAPGAFSALFTACFPSLPIPFKGGTLAAFPFCLQTYLTTGDDGAILIPFVWPEGLPADTELTFQYGIQDADAVQGVALSNALRAVTP